MRNHSPSVIIQGDGFRIMGGHELIPSSNWLPMKSALKEIITL